MPKSQYVDPGKAFDAGYIHFEDIPVCQYNKTFAEESKLYSKEDMMRIYRDMAIIREFETMLNEVKVKSCYNGTVNWLLMASQLVNIQSRLQKYPMATISLMIRLLPLKTRKQLILLSKLRNRKAI